MGKIKLKTHKGTKKSFTKRNSGSVKFKKPGAGHLTGKYSADRSRNLRKGSFYLIDPLIFLNLN